MRAYVARWSPFPGARGSRSTRHASMPRFASCCRKWLRATSQANGLFFSTRRENGTLHMKGRVYERTSGHCCVVPVNYKCVQHAAWVVNGVEPVQELPAAPFMNRMLQQEGTEDVGLSVQCQFHHAHHFKRKSWPIDWPEGSVHCPSCTVYGQARLAGPCAYQPRPVPVLVLWGDITAPMVCLRCCEQVTKSPAHSLHDQGLSRPTHLCRMVAHSAMTSGVILAKLLKLPNVTKPLVTTGAGATAGASMLGV